MSETSQPVYSGLRRFNFLMGILHLLQAILMFALSNDFSLPIQASYLHYDASKFPPIFQQVVEVATLRIGPAVALFLLLSAIAHLLLSTVLYKWYVNNLARHINYARWIEYALSSSLMIVIIAMLCGIYELSSLILIFGLNAAMNLFGLMMELHNQGKDKINWTSFICGVIAGIIPWLVLSIYFWNAIADYRDVIPQFVYWILISIFFFFNTFAINMFLQYRRVGRWKNYLFGEKMYIVLSLLAKTALAWQIFSGTLRPQ